MNDAATLRPGNVARLCGDSRWSSRKEVVDTYEALIKQCSNSRSIADGRRIHSQIVSNGLERDTYLGNLLVQMYGKCGCLQGARAAFQAIQQRNVFSWTILISALVQNGEAEEALELLKLMDLDGTEANKITFIGLLGACSVTKNLSLGKRIHERVRAKGIQSDLVAGNALLNMYTSCNSIEEAVAAFETMTNRDAVSWTVMISGYAQAGHPLEALQLYRRMEQEFARPDAVTMISVVEACASLGAVVQGKAIHERIVATGVDRDVFVGTALVDLYGKCGAVEDARQVFDRVLDKDVVCWNAMLGAYARNQCGAQAFATYLEMVEQRMRPNDVTFITLLDSCCSNSSELKSGKFLHEEAATRGYLSHTSVVNAVINMYAKCGSLEHARRVFTEAVSFANVITWNTMVVATAQVGFNRESLQVYRRMDQEGVKGSDVTYGTVLAVCATLGDLITGREVHSRSVAAGCCTDVVKNSLICLYGGCGNLEASQAAFESVSSKTVVSWSSIIAAYARNGEEAKARTLFWTMDLEGVLPNIVTFTSVLHACSHAGLAEEAWSYFASMQGDHQLDPTSEHYGCLVNLLAKSGRVKQAARLISAMPVPADASTWRSLLGACDVHTDAHSGALAAKQLMDVDPKNSAAYVLLYNMEHRR